MLSILVCHSYFLRLDKKQMERGKPYPPLATLQLAAMLRKAGHRVSLFDAMLAGGIDEYDRMLRAIAPQLVIVYEDNFNFLSKMCLSTMRRAACEMIASGQRAGARVIAAGPDVSDAPGPYLRAGADLALIGEGLSALLMVLPRLDSSPEASLTELIDGLSGVAWHHQGKLLTRSVAGRMLPNPQDGGVAAWDLVDMDRYRSTWLQVHGYFSLNMAASRGCSFHCTWCAKPIWGNQFLQRDPAEVALEMAYLKQSFDPDHIWFADDIFGFRVDWVAQFAAAVKAAEGAVPFSIQTRADLLSLRMVAALRDAGCREAWIGAESGSQRVLDAMNKGTTVAEIRIARQRLKSVGIRAGFFIQLGYLDEQLADIMATRDLIEESRPDEIGVSVAYPLPGTKFYEMVKAQLGGKTHWRESDDLEMMFQGTYRSDFYRAVRNLLHEQVALQTPDTPEETGEQQRARRALDQRWHELVAREGQFRSLPCESAATG